MARLIVLAILAATVAAVYAAPPIGGATSITTYITRALANKKKLGLTYDSVGSSAGITGFLQGTYAVGTSDNPLSSAQFATAVSTYAAGVNTIPLLFSAYSFFTLKTSGLKLTALQVTKVYLGQTKTWKKLKKGLTGTIIPVVRADGSGTTGVITYWLSTATGGKFPYIGNGPLSASVLGKINKNFQSATGTSGVLALAKANPNVICYAQTGAGIAALGGGAEAVLKNPAGKYVSSQTANLQQSIPSSLPPVNQDWSGVHLVDQPGAQTYPVTSFEYSFFQVNYGSTSFPIKNIKKLFEYILSTSGQKLATRQQFAVLPTALSSAYSKAVKAIKV